MDAKERASENAALIKELTSENVALRSEVEQAERVRLQLWDKLDASRARIAELDTLRAREAGLPGEDVEHVYLSTGCLHDQHRYCQSSTGAAGTKIPAQCKFCEAPCVCPCHTSDSAGDGA